MLLKLYFCVCVCLCTSDCSAIQYGLRLRNPQSILTLCPSNRRLLFILYGCWEENTAM